MTESNTKDAEGKPSGNLSEEELAKQRAGVQDKSSHEHMSRERAKDHEGAGGGAKQEQKH